MEEKIEDTFDKLKAGAKAVAEKVSHPDKDLGAEYEREKHKDSEHDANCGCGHEHSDDHGSKEPMNPDQISKHEPTAVKRDKNQSSTGEPV
jgi:ABC-type nickel/cobalt efflux system permease component RcnA